MLHFRLIVPLCLFQNVLPFIHWITFVNLYVITTAVLWSQTTRCLIDANPINLCNSMKFVNLHRCFAFTAYLPHFLSSVQDPVFGNLFNSMWLVAVTFLSIGYGDVVANTYCGRAISIVAGVLVSLHRDALICSNRRVETLTQWARYGRRRIVGNPSSQRLPL